MASKFDWKIQGKASTDIFARLLKERSIEDIEAFLSPDYDAHTHDAYEFTLIDAAAERTVEALKSGGSIVIHGDYDADGVCGSTLLYDVLTDIAARLGYDASVEVYLPDREKDGYGVAMHTIDRFIEQKKQLLITVDCGISNIEEIAAARAGGMDVIICDHHQLHESGEIPDAFVIHPLAEGETYPNKHLCGTGVAFKFATVLLDYARAGGADIPPGYEKWFLDLVAIATVTDIMPLTGENRVLEHFGLLVLEKTRRPGLIGLLDHVRRPGESIDTQMIGFRIGPRLNAPGRIRHAKEAFDALISEPQDVKARLHDLEVVNRQRQVIAEGAATEAFQIAEAQEDESVLIVHREHWNPGNCWTDCRKAC
jgi:single-stranded-DNA-specific exonuclease